MSFFRQLFGFAPARPHTAAMVGRGHVLVDFKGATMGKGSYAVLRRDYLAGLVERNRAALFKAGSVLKWDRTATCTLFASSCVDLCAAEYYAAAFHDASPAPAPAIAEVWFRPDRQIEGHAICAAFTDAGLVFFDPQAPAVGYPLSPTERASIYHVRFL